MTEKSTHSTQILAAIALLAALLAGAAISLCWKQLKNSQTRSSLHIQELKQQAQENQLVLQNMALQLSNFQNVLQRQQTDIASSENQLQKLLKNDPASVENYMLLEAEYLVRQAALNIDFGHNVPAAIMLLQTADQRLLSINDPRLINVRRILANNIAALQAVPKLDLVGLLAQLGALHDQVEQLPLFSLSVHAENNQPTATKDLEEKGWRRMLAISWNAIQKLIVIRHRDEPVVPLLPPDQQTYLRQNLQLLLQQAEWAAMNGQEEIYQSSVQQATRWVKRYFPSNEQASQSMVENLLALQKINVHPNLPNISPTLGAIKQALSQRAVSDSIPTTRQKSQINAPDTSAKTEADAT